MARPYEEVEAELEQMRQQQAFAEKFYLDKIHQLESELVRIHEHHILEDSWYVIGYGVRGIDERFHDKTFYHVLNRKDNDWTVEVWTFHSHSSPSNPDEQSISLKYDSFTIDHESLVEDIDLYERNKDVPYVEYCRKTTREDVKREVFNRVRNGARQLLQPIGNEVEVNANIPQMK